VTRTFRPLQERPVIAASGSLQPNFCTLPPRDPRRAALLSLLPGLGQIYNGETGKGLLFLVVFLSNAGLFASAMFSRPLAGAISSLGAGLRLKLNPESLQALGQSSAASPFFFVYFALIAVFVAYAMREAHDRAMLTRQGAVYPRFVLDLPEAASGSYLLHFLVVACGLIALLVVAVPREPTEQITEIELVPPRPAPPPPAAPKPPQARAPEPPRRVKKVEEVKKPEVAPPPAKPVEEQVQKPTPEPSPVAAAPAAPAASAPAAPSGGTSGSAGSQGAPAGDGQEVDFGAYLAEMQKRIKKAWFPPRGNESKRITVKFKIHKDGEVTSVKLEKSSGLSAADDAALEAIEKAAPFPPLPAGADEIVTIRFTFDYNVFNGGQSAAGSNSVSQ